MKSSDNATVPNAIRVSSGVTEPVLLHSVDVNREHILSGFTAEDRVVTIGMTVDAAGVPTNLTVLQPADKFTDEAILSAVSQYRYKPAMLNGTAVPVDMKVNVRFE